jgi:hypothetical protein
MNRIRSRPSSASKFRGVPCFRGPPGFGETPHPGGAAKACHPPWHALTRPGARTPRATKACHPPCNSDAKLRKSSEPVGRNTPPLH